MKVFTYEHMPFHWTAWKYLFIRQMPLMALIIGRWRKELDG